MHLSIMSTSFLIGWNHKADYLCIRRSWDLLLVIVNRYSLKWYLLSVQAQFTGAGVYLKKVFLCRPVSAKG